MAVGEHLDTAVELIRQGDIDAALPSLESAVVLSEANPAFWTDRVGEAGRLRSLLALCERVSEAKGASTDQIRELLARVDTLGRSAIH
jgi:hypothetical protein